MTKELEALERIGRIEYCDKGGVVTDIKFGDSTMKDYQTVEKSLKAFEILRSRIAEVWKFEHKGETTYGIAFGVFEGESDLTKEEYDLLDEVLEEEEKMSKPLIKVL